MKRVVIALVLTCFASPLSAWAASKPAGFLCSIPPKDPRSKDVPVVRLKIAADDNQTWNGVRIGAKDRNAYIDEAKRYDPHPEFRLSAEADVPFRTVQPVLTKIAEAGTYWMTLNTSDNHRAAILCYLKGEKRLKMPAMTHIGLRRDGALLWNGWPVDDRTFADYAGRLARDRRHPLVVVIEPDPDTAFRAVVGTMKKLIAAGLSDIAIGRYGRFVPENKAR